MSKFKKGIARQHIVNDAALHKRKTQYAINEE